MRTQVTSTPSWMMLLCLTAQDQFYNAQFLEQLRNTPEITWTPAIPENLKGYTYDEMMSRFVYQEQPVIRNTKEAQRAHIFPEAFNAHDHWANCTSPVQDTGPCASSWFTIAADQFAERRCIHFGHKARYMDSFSYQYAMDCSPDSAGCQGINSNKLHLFIKNRGLPKASCYHDQTGLCPTVCSDGTVPEIFNCDGFGEAGILYWYYRDIYEQGAIQTRMYVYEDFLYYGGGVYRHFAGRRLGMTSVLFYGWGEENNTKYWLAKATLGTQWGDGGYFRIARQENECGCEEYEVSSLAFYK